jgi:hypothetical protein
MTEKGKAPRNDLIGQGKTLQAPRQENPPDPPFLKGGRGDLNETDEIDQIDQTDEIDETDHIS